MATKEKTIQDKIKRYLKGLHPKSWVEKIHGGPFQRAGIPDLEAAIPGLTERFIRIEVKRPGEYPDDRQKRTIKALAEAGVFACVARSVEDMQKVVSLIRAGWNPVDLAAWSLGE